MIADKALAQFRVAPGPDGDVRQEKGGTQKFLAVEVHSPRRKRSEKIMTIRVLLEQLP
jgi:hypothetical protein